MIIGQKKIIFAVGPVTILVVGSNEIVHFVLLNLQAACRERISNLSSGKAEVIDQPLVWLKVPTKKVQIEESQPLHEVDGLLIPVSAPINISEPVAKLDGSVPLEASERQPSIF
jgi:hypothetical protein